MANALALVPAEPGRCVIVATHSPELLNLPSARHIHTRREETGCSSLVSLKAVDLAALHDLGLSPSDLLRRQRAFLLVEGEHDERSHYRERPRNSLLSLDRNSTKRWSR